MRSNISLFSLFVLLVFAAVLVAVSQRTRCWAAQDHAPTTRRPLPPAEELAKLPPDGGPRYNRLVFEKSPYLLQHAGNPVDWYPWGEEAFEEARHADKPIFLSIGYSTCHWCHVMEHESFEDSEVAKLMNEHFVSIKVDREERPDIDNVYMTVCQAMTGSGGWPLTIVMTPDKQPFFAGTYFPKSARFGREGMMQLVSRLGRDWQSERDELLNKAQRATARLKSSYATRPGDEPDAKTHTLAFQELQRSFDAAHGGFGWQPKFPMPHNLSYLLRYWKRSGDGAALRMVEQTLKAMRAGGLYDHVGFGFHRYSTDEEWLVPHFEKMLYDQAGLLIAYVEAYQATGKEEYARTAGEIMTYVLRDMTSPEGGFYSAEDADSEGIEGKFYVWKEDEVEAVLGTDEARLFNAYFNIRPDGNFHAAHSPPRSNIPHVTRDVGAVAADLRIEPADVERRLESARRKLFNVREKRVRPRKDDKILTDWNGLMIAAASIAARGLGEESYALAARRAADFVLSRLRDDRGRLIKRYRDGQAGLPAHVEDYAFMIWGLLELYESTLDEKYLDAVLELNSDMLNHFWDEKAGGFYFYADDGEPLLARPKEIYDGAIPSGNSVAMLNLMRLGRVTGDSDLEEHAATLMRAFSRDVIGGPSSHTRLMCGLDFALGPSFEVVIAGDRGAADTHAMIAALHKPFLPNKVVLFRPDSERPLITTIAPFTENQTMRNKRATAYVCRNYLCRSPTNDISRMLEYFSEPIPSGKTGE